MKTQGLGTFKTEAQPPSSKSGHSPNEVDSNGGKTVQLNSTPEQKRATDKVEVREVADPSQLKIGTKVLVDSEHIEAIGPEGFDGRVFPTKIEKIPIKVVGEIIAIQGDKATVRYESTQRETIEYDGLTSLSSGGDFFIDMLEMTINVGESLRGDKHVDFSTFIEKKEIRLADLRGKQVVNNSTLFFKDAKNNGILKNVPMERKMFTANGDFYTCFEGGRKLPNTYKLSEQAPVFKYKKDTIEYREKVQRWALLPVEEGQHELVFVGGTLSNGEMAIRSAPNPIPGMFSSKKKLPETQRLFRSIPGDGLIYENAYPEGEKLRPQTRVVVEGRGKAKVLGVFGNLVALRQGKKIIYAKRDEVNVTNGWHLW